MFVAQSLPAHSNLARSQAVDLRVAPGTRQRLERFFQKHAPEKVASIDKLLPMLAGKEDRAFAALVHKYGPEPPNASLASPELTELSEEFFDDHDFLCTLFDGSDSYFGTKLAAPIAEEMLVATNYCYLKKRKLDQLAAARRQRVMTHRVLPLVGFLTVILYAIAKGLCILLTS